MKKIIYSGLMLLAGLTFASCAGDYDDWADPQHNDPEQAAAAYGVTIAAGSGATVSMPVANDMIPLVAISSSNQQVVGYRINTLTINGKEYAAQVIDNNICVSADQLEYDIQIAADSRAQQTVPLTIVSRVAAVLANGDAISVEGTTQGNFTTAAPPAEDPNGYYLLGGFVGNGWNLATPIWMENKGNGIYMATVETTDKDSNWYKFYQGSHYDAESWDVVNRGQMGCQVNGDDTNPNFLVWEGDKYSVQTPVIKGLGKWDITLDVKNMKYSYAVHSDLVYLPGDANGWSFNKDILAGNGDGTFAGYALLGGQWGWKVTQFPNWDNGDFGDGGEGKLAAGGGNIMEGSTPTFYRVVINFVDYTYELTEINMFSITGDVTGGWGIDTDMTFDADSRSWTVTADFQAGEFKFRANNDWAWSLGGSFDSMTDANGANLKLEEAGNYTITLYPTYNGNSHCTVVKN